MGKWAATAAALPLLPIERLGWASNLPTDVTITRVVGFDLPTRRRKIVGKNSFRGVHGDRSSDPILRIFTNADVDGLGYCRVSRDVARQLLETPVSDFFCRAEKLIRSPLGRQTMPLWDVAGKLLDRPVFELLGNHGMERVTVYDGSIYFSDLQPEYSSNWRDRFKHEVDESIASGHRAVKIKIGRGKKWMSRAEGNRRDREIIKLVREHVGEDFLIGIDANNGYDLTGAKELITDIAEHRIAFVEELFDESVEECLEFKRFLGSEKLETLLADGETQHQVAAFQPFVDAGALDVLQGDMNSFGIEGVLAQATLAAAKGIRIAPHNWGSLVGFYHQLQVARGISNFYLAEYDPLVSDVLVADGFLIGNGTATVPDTPGVGLTLDEQRLADRVPRFDLAV